MRTAAPQATKVAWANNEESTGSTAKCNIG